ncbi:MAG TPA: glycoside hydrolase family 3 N-terminal domain-containing protein [Rugosimonospora sp.]|nr:glycoside hydrolase family 3 N-terminal domain-containing protein [Rugosimonospora sp.]
MRSLPHPSTLSRLAAALAGALVVVTAAAGCSLLRGADETATGPGFPLLPQQLADPAATAAAIVAAMSDEELVGQVLVPYAYGDDANTVSPGSRAGNQQIGGVDTPAQLVARYKLGGLILVSFSADDPTGDTNPTTNLENPAQVRTLTSGLQTASGRVPLLIGTDQEYGVVNRLSSGIVQLPAAMALGAAGDPGLTRAAWAAAGADLAAVGINVDFAPDADVLGPGGNGVIGSRSFGQDPKAVADQVAAAVQGLQSAGVAATLKHFPGHGHTLTDSHESLPQLTQSLADLDSGDLPPFTSGIAAGTDLVMSGHLDVRAIDPGVPASFSSKVLIDLLRGKLGFTGVVITDALNMAPAEVYPPGEAAWRAIVAGNDMLLMPPDLPAAQQGLLAALKSGQLPRARLVEAVTRIVTLKVKLSGGPRAADVTTVGGSQAQQAAQAVAAAGVTVLKGACTGPLVKGAVTVTASGGRDQAVAWLKEALAADGVTVRDSGGTVVHLVGYGDTAADLSASARVTVAMDTPYILANAKSPVRVATYSSSQPSMRALAAVLAGKATPTGVSPVDVRGLPRTACA